MNNYHVCVVSSTGKPLMPTKRFKKVRKLLKFGQAKAIVRKPFTIQLKYETDGYTQPYILGIDPGGKEIGISLRKDNGEIIELGHLEARSTEVSENMTNRRMYRRSRRRHHRLKRQRRAKKCKTNFEEKRYQITGIGESLLCKWIKPKLVKFHNRCREKGWLTPTARHLLTTHKNIVKKIAKRLPIKEVSLEYGKFDLQKLNAPEIQGVEYQNGRKKGFGNAQQYALCRDKHTCRLCNKNNKLLQVHHVIWGSKGGADTPENLLTLCVRCHKKVHKNAKTDSKVKELFKGVRKRQVHTTLLNTIMPAFQKWLEKKFDKVSITYGYKTKEKRRELGLAKEHFIDAYLVSLKDADDGAEIDWENMDVYRYKQFRRHHRQIIHAMRDRNYKDGKKIVAKNRRKRTGQTEDSLLELIENKGKSIMACLRILPGKKVIRSMFKAFAKGDVVKYKGKHYVVKGYGEMGRRLGFVDCKDYVPTKECRLVTRNQGLVCI